MLSKKLLRAPKRSPQLGAAVVGFGLLLVLAATAGMVRDLRESTRNAPQTSLAPAKTSIPGTEIPLPPASFHLQARTGKMPTGRHIFRPVGQAMSVADSQRLFNFYLSAMHSQGWTLVGKGDPDAHGEWTLNWTFDKLNATVYLYTAPTTRLTVDSCPPMKYC